MTQNSVVALQACESYDTGRVLDRVIKALEPFGGIHEIINPGDRVLIKVNLLNDTPPDLAIVTHPSLTRAVIRLVRKAGGIPVVGDQSGPVLKGITLRAFQVSGTLDVCKQEGAEIAPFNAKGYREINCPDNIHLKTLFIARDVLEADRIIGIAKLKTHMQAIYTGAIKNYFGCIPLRDRKIAHLLGRYPIFCEAIVDIFNAVDPDFTLIDGIVAMEGMGPNRGDPKKLGVILAARDHVACDAVALELIGINPEAYPVLKNAAQRGFGEDRRENIRLVGDEISRFRTTFKLPPKYIRNPPKVLAGWFAWLYDCTLKVDPDHCEGCGACMQSCPAGAITMQPKAFINRGNCIECLCCMELCPHEAVYESPPTMVRAIRKIKAMVYDRQGR